MSELDPDHQIPHTCSCCGDGFTDIEPRVCEDINGKKLAFCSKECEYFQMGVPA